MNLETLKNTLIAKKIRPSIQRIKVLEFLYDNDIHPTVDEVYNALSIEIPSLSKATVYNTLHTLIDGGLVKLLNIEDHESRYELLVKNHGHFKCTGCGRIFNFNIDIDSLIIDGLSKFTIAEKNIVFKGLCQDCNQSHH